MRQYRKSLIAVVPVFLFGVIGSNQVAAGKQTSNVMSIGTASSHSFGWRYVEFPKSIGASPQIGGVEATNGQLQLVVVTEKTVGGALENEYSASTYNPTTNRLSSSSHIVKEPKTYSGPWKLEFGQMNGHKPASMTLVNTRTLIPIPSSIPAYMSEINPATGDPGGLDNRILGQSGDWVWIAMKGRGEPPIPQLVWGYRQWNRILAVNTHTKVMKVFSIPAGTSRTNTWWNPPSFGVVGTTVWIGTGNWLGAFPADPSHQSALSMLVPEPRRTVLSDQTAMVRALSNLESQAATGITNYWNNYVMKGNEKAMNESWIGDPAVYNHGDFPLDFYWALNFPLDPKSSAYRTRTKLVGEIQHMLKSPLTMAWIAYPDPASMQAHFHGTPPTDVPGYKIVGGYYVKQ